MPYLDQPWRPPEEFAQGEWVPELDQHDWLDRHRDLPHASWVKLDGLTDDDAEYLQSTNLSADERRKYLKALGADIGSAQRDGFFYTNFLEQLKRAAPLSTDDPDADKAAGEVIERMKVMGFTSANLDEQHGGPPKGNSPRPWRAVMKWLSSLTRKVWQFLVNAAQTFGALARRFTADTKSHATISFSASIPPAIAFDVDLEYVIDSNKWKLFKEFLNDIWAQMEKLVGT
jgi:hypothetical protein